MRRAASLLALLGAVACGSDAPDVAAPGPEVATTSAVLVETTRVERGTVQPLLSASGTIEARRTSEIGPEVPGRLVEVFVDVGDAVDAGQPLFRIDPGPYEMALAEERAGLALARAEAHNATQEAERADRLIAQGASSQQAAEQLRTRAAVGLARVEQAEARQDRAERDLARTLVTAPYAGSVVARLAHEGAVAEAEPVIVVQESGALEAILAIPEAAGVNVRVGDAVLLYTDAGSAPIESRVHRVSDRIDPETRTYEVRAPVEAPSGTVKAGAWVRAELRPHPGEPGPVLDRAALLLRDGRTTVFRVDDGVAVQVPVRVGPSDGRRTRVVSGLRAGDLVVRGEVIERLGDGAAVRLAEPAGDGESRVAGP